MKAQASIVFVALMSCSNSASLPAPRFANAPPVLVVNDRRDVARPPARRDPINSLYHFDGSFRRPITRALELPPPRRARGVNALDEVPDSTWFTNRVTVRELTPDEIRTGPITIEGPERFLPWTVHSSKTAGESLGMFVTDTRGEKFLVKFDRKGFPEIETAAQVIVGRLLWACGYNVTEDFIVYLKRGDLRLAADAKRTDPVGDEVPYTQEDLARELAGVELERDGRLRVMASRMLPGKALGGHAGEGVRKDDPNDVIAHELRRDLRGLRPIFAWLDHVDIKQDNFLDMWQRDPADPDRHFVRHYMIDYGKSLGGMAAITKDETRAYEYRVDYAEMLNSFTTLGLRKHKWDGRSAPALRGVGLFETTTFDPKRWKPLTQAYIPLVVADRYDWLWGAKVVLSFTRDQLRAAVEMGRLSDPRATEYLVDALVARQRAVARYAFSLVRPLDEFTIGEGSALCFDDLLLVNGFATRSPSTNYVATSFDRRGRRLGAPRTSAARLDGRTCIGVPLATDEAGYTIVRIRTNGTAVDTFVHVAREPVTSAMRLIGLWRE